MPTYCFSNEDRSRVEERFYSMSQRVPKHIRVDGFLLKRDIVCEQKRSGGHKASCWPMKPSMSMGCIPSEAKKRQSLDDELGVPTEWAMHADGLSAGPVWTSQEHQNRWLRAHGKVNTDGGYNTPRPGDFPVQETTFDPKEFFGRR